MRSLQFLAVALALILLNVNCSSKSAKSNTIESIAKADKVEVFYFHFNRRCATCNAVEEVSKLAIAETYGDKVSFESCNLDEKEGKEKGNNLGVSAQTLLIVSGEAKINITSQAFMNARSNPEKLKALIKEKIDPLL
nr:nitrophenyl compound nitroreductase subunit ArsF family protein [uncultured Carboxylicivirga sp.]